MSSIITGSPYSRYSSISPVRSLGEIVFHSTLSIPNNFSSQLALPVNFTDSPLFIGRLGKFSEAFLTLKYITISSQKSPSFSDKHRAGVNQVNNFSAGSGGVTTFTFTFNNGNPTFFKSLFFYNGVISTSALSVGTIQVAPHTILPQVDLQQNIVAPFVAAGPQILLTNYFDAIDGLINFDPTNIGFDVSFKVNNTSGSTQNMLVACFGAVYAYDWIQMLVRYKDWKGNIYNAGVFDDLTRIQTFPLGQQVQTPIIDPAQKNFGSIIFDPIAFNSFFNASYTYDVVLSGSVEFFQG